MLDRGIATRRVTGLSGLGVVILFGVGNALWAFEQPDAGDSAREIVAFYADTSAEIIIGGSLSLFAIALFVLFVSGVRGIFALAIAVVALRAKALLPRWLLAVASVQLLRLRDA